MTKIRIGTVTVEYTPDGGCISTYATDGRFYGAQPHATPHYHVIAHRCGYGDDLSAYCREHEVCHHLVAEWIVGGWSKVIRPLAEGRQPDADDAVLEEALTQTFQRWLRANERPIIGDVDWDDLKARALELLHPQRQPLEAIRRRARGTLYGLASDVHAIATEALA